MFFEVTYMYWGSTVSFEWSECNLQETGGAKKFLEKSSYKLHVQQVTMHA